MDSVLTLLAERTCYWWLGQAGALVQIVGAGLLVRSAFKTRAQIKGIRDTWDANLTERLRDVIAGQAYSSLIGFVSLTGGLILQALASLGS